MHIVITGSTRGIGKGLAEYFLTKRCKVTINGTSQSSVDKALNNFSKYDKKIQGIAGNVAAYQEMENLWIKAVEGFGPVDIFINNAGVNQENDLFHRISFDSIQKIVDINIVGVMYGSQVAMKYMLKQGHGQIFNMEGLGSDGRTMVKSILYGTTKRALTYFTKGLAKEAKDTCVKVGRLSPGMVATEFLAGSVTDENKKIMNILVDDVKTVTTYLGEGILKNKKNDAHIAWLTNSKIMVRFLTAPFNKKQLFD